MILKNLVFLLLLVFLYFFIDAQKVAEEPKKYAQMVDTLKARVIGAVKQRDFNALLRYTASGIALSANHSEDAAYFSYFRGHAFFEMKKYDSAIANALLSVELYKRNKDILGESRAMRRLHYCYYYAGRGKERVPMINRALNIVDTTTETDAKKELLAMLGEYYFDQNLYERSISYKIKYITLLKENAQPYSDQVSNDIAVTSSQIAETYLTLNEPGKAVEYLTEAVRYYRDFYHGEAISTKNFVDAYVRLNMPDSATVYYKKLYHLMKPDDTLFEILSAANGNMANYYLGQNNNDRALTFAGKALDLSRKSQEPIEIMSAHLTLANILCKMKRYKEALEHLSVIENGSAAFGREGVASIWQLQGEVFAGLGMWKEAYSANEKYVILRDSINKENSSKAIADAEAIYQNREKRLQIEAKNILLNNAQKQRLWLITGLVLLGLVVALLIFIYRNKKKTADALDDKNKQLFKLNDELDEANQTKAKLFSIIGHDLRSPINQVYQFLQLQQLNPNALNPVQKTELNNKIKDATGSLLETMEDLLLWSKTQMSAFTTTIQPVNVSETVKRSVGLQQLAIDAKKLTVQNQCPEHLMVQTDPYYLQAILRNLLQNAAKAAPEASDIIIRAEGGNSISIENKGAPFTQKEYEHVLNDSDNSKGLSGLGLRLVDELSKKAGIQVRFHASDDKTVVRVKFVNS